MVLKGNEKKRKMAALCAYVDGCNGGHLSLNLPLKATTFSLENKNKNKI